jgi:hypothetical protein
VLVAVVREPGQMTAADIATEVYPMPDELRIRGPFRSRAHRTTLLAARDEHWTWAVGRVSQHLGELVRRGLVERVRPPAVAPWFRGSIERRGSLVAALARLEFPDETPGPTLDAWAAMVRDYEQSPGVWRPGKSGAEQETYRALVALGVFEAPSQRWPTVAGVELVHKWNEVES